MRERIREKAMFGYDHDEATEAYMKAWGEGGLCVRLEEVLALLDGAAAKFPKDSDEKYEGKLFTERNVLLSVDRFRWFEEVFGGRGA